MDELLQSVYDQPELWSTTKHRFSRGNFHIWIGNGFSHIQPYESACERLFGWRDRRRWWKAYKWWCKTAPAEALAGQ